MKTSELTGKALDWAVAKCEGFAYLMTDKGPRYKVHGPHGGWEWYGPSKHWDQAGPIIDREGIDTIHERNAEGEVVQIWAVLDQEQVPKYFGETPLIAAMRCFVASKLGDEVEVPDDLTS